MSVNVLETLRSLHAACVLRCADMSLCAPAVESIIGPIEDLITIASDVNEWLIRTDPEGTAHQRHLAQVLAVVKGEAA